MVLRPRHPTSPALAAAARLPARAAAALVLALRFLAGASLAAAALLAAPPMLLLAGSLAAAALEAAPPMLLAVAVFAIVLALE